MYSNVGKQIKSLVATIAVIEIIAFVITGIIVACVDFEYMWWVGLIIIIGGLLVTWISYLFLYAYGELVDKTSLIESYLNTNIGNSSASHQNRVAGPNEWKCKQCGAINQNYVGTCGCGYENPSPINSNTSSDGFLSKIKSIPSMDNQSKTPNSDNIPSVTKPKRTAGANEWECSKCGTINQNYVGTCGCGQTKAEN